MKYDLGGVGNHPGYKTVNCVKPCDILSDIMNLDNFVEDGVAEEFFLSHTLEHIPIEHYHKFLLDMKKKLMLNGTIVVVQTDVGKTIMQWARGELSFRAMRSTVFTPAERILNNPYQRHHNMWSAEELAKDFQVIGMEAVTFDAGGWPFDVKDEFYNEECTAYHGVTIKNLGVRAKKI